VTQVKHIHSPETQPIIVKAVAKPYFFAFTRVIGFPPEEVYTLKQNSF